jgi:hypothetical protein
LGRDAGRGAMGGGWRQGTESGLSEGSWGFEFEVAFEGADALGDAKLEHHGVDHGTAASAAVEVDGRAGDPVIDDLAIAIGKAPEKESLFVAAEDVKAQGEVGIELGDGGGGGADGDGGIDMFIEVFDIDGDAIEAEVDLGVEPDGGDGDIGVGVDEGPEVEPAVVAIVLEEDGKAGVEGEVVGAGQIVRVPLGVDEGPLEDEAEGGEARVDGEGPAEFVGIEGDVAEGSGGGEGIGEEDEGAVEGKHLTGEIRGCVWACGADGEYAVKAVEGEGGLAVEVGEDGEKGLVVGVEGEGGGEGGLGHGDDIGAGGAGELGGDLSVGGVRDVEGNGRGTEGEVAGRFGGRGGVRGGVGERRRRGGVGGEKAAEPEAGEGKNDEEGGNENDGCSRGGFVHGEASDTKGRGFRRRKVKGSENPS